MSEMRAAVEQAIALLQGDGDKFTAQKVLEAAIAAEDVKAAPVEFPKFVGDQIVHSAEEEAKLAPPPAAARPAAATPPRSGASP